MLDQHTTHHTYIRRRQKYDNRRKEREGREQEGRQGKREEKGRQGKREARQGKRQGKARGKARQEGRQGKREGKARGKARQEGRQGKREGNGKGLLTSLPASSLPPPLSACLLTSLSACLLSACLLSACLLSLPASSALSLPPPLASYHADCVYDLWLRNKQTDLCLLLSLPPLYPFPLPSLHFFIPLSSSSLSLSSS